MPPPPPSFPLFPPSVFSPSPSNLSSSSFSFSSSASPSPTSNPSTPSSPSSTPSSSNPSSSSSAPSSSSSASPTPSSAIQIPNPSDKPPSLDSPTTSPPLTSPPLSHLPKNLVNSVSSSSFSSFLASPSSSTNPPSIAQLHSPPLRPPPPLSPPSSPSPPTLPLDSKAALILQTRKRVQNQLREYRRLAERFWDTVAEMTWTAIEAFVTNSNSPSRCPYHRLAYEDNRVNLPSKMGPLQQQAIIEVIERETQMKVLRWGFRTDYHTLSRSFCVELEVSITAYDEDGLPPVEAIYDLLEKSSRANDWTSMTSLGAPRRMLATYKPNFQ